MDFRLLGLSNSRRLTISIAVAFFAAGPPLLGGSAALACQPPAFRTPAILAAASDRPAGQPDSKFAVSGTIEAVNYAKNTIDVQGAAGKMTIVITPTTAIAVHGQAGGISDLRPGVHVNATGVAKNGINVALTITIK